jgi:hypothetical protein
MRTSMGLEALVAVESRPGLCVSCLSRGEGGGGRGILEGNAVLCDALKPGLPDEGDVAGVCCLQSPGQKGRNCVSANWRLLACEQKARKKGAGVGRRVVEQRTGQYAQSGDGRDHVGRW